jgi:hypothetical protein
MLLPFTWYSLRGFGTLPCSMNTPQSSAESYIFRRGSDRSTERSPLSADPLANARDYSDHGNQQNGKQHCVFDQRRTVFVRLEFSDKLHKPTHVTFLYLVSPPIYSVRGFGKLLCRMTPQSSAEATFFVAVQIAVLSEAH